MEHIYYATDCNTLSLTHHGILGMKWGVRRYQNEDGTYTKAGKEHKKQLTQEEMEQRFNKRIGQGTAIGAAAGVATGALVTATDVAIQAASLGGLAAVMASNPAVAAGQIASYFIGKGIEYAAKGAMSGAVYGTVYGTYEAYKGQSYVNNTDSTSIPMSKVKG